MDDPDPLPLINPYDPRPAREAFRAVHADYGEGGLRWVRSKETAGDLALPVNRRAWLIAYADVVGSFRAAVERIDSWPEDFEVQLAHGRLTPALQRLQTVLEAAAGEESPAEYAAWAHVVAVAARPVPALIEALNGQLGGEPLAPVDWWHRATSPGPPDPLTAIEPPLLFD